MIVLPPHWVQTVSKLRSPLRIVPWISKIVQTAECFCLHMTALDSSELVLLRKARDTLNPSPPPSRTSTVTTFLLCRGLPSNSWEKRKEATCLWVGEQAVTKAHSSRGSSRKEQIEKQCHHLFMKGPNYPQRDSWLRIASLLKKSRQKRASVTHTKNILMVLASAHPFPSDLMTL